MTHKFILHIKILVIADYKILSFMYIDSQYF